MPTGPEWTTPTEALAAVQTYFELLTADRAEYKDWVGGTVDGGPGLDGDYPLTDFTDNTYLVPCPAKIAATVALTMADLVPTVPDTWAALDALVVTVPGMMAAVYGDAGTHLDPVSETMVKNSGLYRWDDGEEAWEHISDFPVMVDTDGTLAADSDTRVPSQKAVKTALAAAMLGFLKIQDEIDCSTNPMFPEALAGDCYVVSEAGLIGGALGQFVLADTLLIARIDNAGGNLTTAGPDWFIIGNASGTGGSGGGSSDVNVVATATYDLLYTDVDAYLRAEFVGSKAFTVQSNASEPIDVNSEITIYNATTGDLTVVEDVGVTVNAPAAGSLVVPPNGLVTLKKVDGDEWDLLGSTYGNSIYTDEEAQDAVGDMVDGTLIYTDAGPTLKRAALTGAITAAAGSNATALGAFTKAELDGAVSDGNVLFVGDMTQYTDEMARDALGTALTAGAGITLTPNDGADTITVASSITQYTDENAMDAVAAMLTAGSGISVSYNDGSNTFTITNTGGGGGGGLSAEDVMDLMNTTLAAGAGISLSYNDAGDLLTITCSITQYTNEMAMDAIAAMILAGNGLDVTYVDGSDTFTIDVDLSEIEATSTEMWTGTSTTKAVTPKKLFDAALEVAVAYAGTITLDGNTGLNFKTTLTGNLILANPTNMKEGQSGLIILTQDGTGSRTITYGTNWKFPGGAAVGGVLSTTAAAVDMISYFVRNDGTIVCGLAKDLKS